MFGKYSGHCGLSVGVSCAFTVGFDGEQSPDFSFRRCFTRIAPSPWVKNVTNMRKGRKERPSIKRHPTKNMQTFILNCGQNTRKQRKARKEALILPTRATENLKKKRQNTSQCGQNCGHLSIFERYMQWAQSDLL